MSYSKARMQFKVAMENLPMKTEPALNSLAKGLHQLADAVEADIAGMRQELQQLQQAAAQASR